MTVRDVTLSNQTQRIEYSLTSSFDKNEKKPLI